MGSPRVRHNWACTHSIYLLSWMKNHVNTFIQYHVRKKKACHKIIIAFKVIFCGFTSTLYITYIWNTCSFKRKKWKNIYQTINNNFYPLLNILLGFAGGTDQSRRCKRHGVPSLDWEDPLENKIATHSNILAWKIPWTELGRLQSVELWRVRHDWVTKHTNKWLHVYVFFPFI